MNLPEGSYVPNSLLVDDLKKVFRLLNKTKINKWFIQNICQYLWIGEILISQLHGAITTFFAFCSNPSNVTQALDGKPLNYNDLSTYKLTIGNVFATLETISAQGTIHGFETPPTDWKDSNKKRKAAGDAKSTDSPDDTTPAAGRRNNNHNGNNNNANNHNNNNSNSQRA